MKIVGGNLAMGKVNEIYSLCAICDGTQRTIILNGTIDRNIAFTFRWKMAGRARVVCAF